MTSQEKIIKELTELSSKGLNIITRKDFDLNKKKKEISEMEMQIDDFEIKGFAVELEKVLLDNLYKELEDLDFDKEHIYQEHIIMDDLAIAIGKYNGAEIHTFGEAKTNNIKLKSNLQKLTSQIKQLNLGVEKAKTEKEKDTIRLEIIKSEGLVIKVKGVMSKYSVDFKDFLELDETLNGDIKELNTKIDSLKTKASSNTKELDLLYLDLVDENKSKETQGELAQIKIDEIKSVLELVENELPQHEIKLAELMSEQEWLGKQINLPSKEFIGLEAKLKIWDKKKDDLIEIISAMESRFYIKSTNKNAVEGENPLKDVLERVRGLSEAMDEEEAFDEEQEDFVSEEVSYGKQSKKMGINPFVFSMLALGGYLAFKK
jgi:outer membrane murein-binding lipoprotein Lpp